MRLGRNYSEIKIQSGMIVGLDSNVHHCLCDLPECFELNYGSSFFSKNQKYLLLHGPAEGPFSKQ